MIGTRRTALLALGLAVLAAGCDLLPAPFRAPEPSASPPTTVEAARRAWLAAGIIDYNARISLGCVCTVTGTYEVSVEGGVATRVVKDGEAIGLDNDAMGLLTIEGIFQAALDTEQTGRAMGTWDPRTGAPVTLALDPALNGDDDEVHIEVERIEPAT